MRKVVDALLTSGLCWAYNSTRSPPPACACVCKSVSVTSVRTRSWLLWRWRRGRQRRNMIHGKLSRSSESGSKRWPQLWKKVLSLRWKPPCISARSFARLARYPAAHPGLPAAPLVSWPRMRVYVCYNNVAKGVSSLASSLAFQDGEKTSSVFSPSFTSDVRMRHALICKVWPSTRREATPSRARAALITRIFQAR